jgi:non-canonical (house-cleaning) NTP pyrophosphatase
VSIVKVGSTSIHKVGPVRSAFRSIVPGHSFVIGVPTKTGVSEMPYGMKETMRGATNRAEAVWEPGIISFGIEGGMVDLPNLSPWWKRLASHLPKIGNRFASSDIYLCMAVIAMKDTNGRIYYSTSAGMQFPAWVVKEAKKENLTTGQVLSRRFGGDPTDPRYIISFGRTHRGDSIEDAVKLVMYNIF